MSVRRRQDSILNGTFLASGIFFLLVLGLFTNYLLSTLLANLEDSLIARLEHETNLHVEYDSLRIGFFDTIVLEGVQVRHAEEGRLAPLARVDKAELSFRLLKFIFGSGEAIENISAIRLHKPELNFYSDTSLISAISSIPRQEKRKEEALPPLLNCTVRIEEGSVRFYTEDSYRQSISASPLVVLSIPDGNLDVRNNRGEFRLKSDFSILPSQDIAGGSLGVEGKFDLDAASIDAAIDFSDMLVSGVSLPDLRFSLLRDDESLTLDSSFGQALSLGGQYQMGESGKFVLTLEEREGFFDRPAEREHRGTLGRLFFSDARSYTPSGRMELSFEGPGFTLRSDLVIRDDGGNDVFRLRARGDEKNLSVERMELSRGEHLISISAYWEWSGIPHARALIRGLELGAVVLDGDLRLEPQPQDSLRLFASAVRVNGTPLGNFDGTFNPKSSEFSLTGFAGSLRGSGKAAGDAREILLALQGFDLGALLGGISKRDMFDGWRGSGDARVSFGDMGVRASGVLAIATPGFGTANVDFSFDEENLIIRELKTAYATIRGIGNVGHEGVYGNFNIDYGGRNYPFILQYRETEGGRLINADIRGLLQAQADIVDGNVRALVSLNGLSLHPFGFDAHLSGSGSLTVQDQHSISVGNFSLAFRQPYQASVDLVFRGEGARFDIIQLGCVFEGRSFSGNGTVILNEQKRWDMNVVFDNGLSAAGYFDGGAYGGTFLLSDVDVGAILPGVASGVLRGSVTLAPGRGFPSLAWSVILSDGKLFDAPVQVITRARAHSSGFDAMTVLIQSEIGEISIRNGRVVREDDGFACTLDAALRWRGAPFPAQGQLRVQGKVRDTVSEAEIFFSDVRAHSRARGNYAAQVRFSDDRFVFQRIGAAGIEGEIDNRNKNVDLKFTDSAGTDITISGHYGQDVDLAGSAAGLPLLYLENFPEVVRSAQGTVSADYRIHGPHDAPDFSGTLMIDDAVFDTKFLRTPLTSLSVAARFTNDILYIDNVSATNGKGALYISGQAVARNKTLEDIDVRVRTDRKAGININIDGDNLKTSGGLLADLFISGNLDAPVVQGRVALQNNEFYFMSDGDRDSRDDDRFLNRIQWNLEVNALNDVRFVHPFVTALLQSGSGIVLQNSIGDPNFDVSGSATASRGMIDYINHEFRIEQPTFIEFRRTGRGVEPWLTFRGRLRIRDEDFENIDIYISFEGSLVGGLNPVFSSEPSRSEREIHALLGLEQTDVRYYDGARQQDDLLYRSADVISLSFLNPLSKEIRQLFGLDIVTIRTPFMRNFLERERGDQMFDDGINRSLFRGTRFSVGKYITDFAFLEGTVLLRESLEPVNPTKLIPALQIGFEVTHKSANFGVALKPVETNIELEYECAFEIRIRGRF
jgi:hypothetical protein